MTSTCFASSAFTASTGMASDAAASISIDRPDASRASSVAPRARNIGVASAGPVGGAAPIIVAVSLDEDKETAAIVPRQNKVKFPIVFDPKGAIAEKYKVQAIPHTVVIDKSGKVQQVITGLDLQLLDKSVGEVMQ